MCVCVHGGGHLPHEACVTAISQGSGLRYESDMFMRLIKLHALPDLQHNAHLYRLACMRFRACAQDAIATSPRIHESLARANVAAAALGLPDAPGAGSATLYQARIAILPR